MADGDQLPKSERFRLLRNPRRRYVLRYLSRQDGEAELDELVEHVAVEENDVPPDELTEAQRRRIHISLDQSHLPVLEEAGIVSYHDDTNVVERRHRAAVVEQYLERRGDRSRRWVVYYAVLALGAVGVAGAHWAGIPPIDGVSPLSVSLLIVGVLLVVSLLHRTTANR